MKTVAALFITATVFLTNSVPVIAETVTIIHGYTTLHAPAGTTDAVRQQAGQRMLVSADQAIGYLQPLATTDAVRQQTGQRISMTPGSLVSHLEPLATTDAVRQQTGRSLHSRHSRYLQARLVQP